jgi:L,D-transpeptidase YbiS
MTKKKIVLIVTLIFVGVVVLMEVVGYRIEIFKWSRMQAEDLRKEVSGKSLNELRAKNVMLGNRINIFSPKGVYLAIDTGENKIFIKDGTKVLRQAVVSCGSGDILEEPGGERKWIFDTPRGEFSVQSKLVHPTWIKPDWAFIEEGEKPPANYNDRIDNESLGDYALGFGDGFFIHGTLYTRLLGRNVTHGCIRMGDEDLKTVFQYAVPGTRIYIY